MKFILAKCTLATALLAMLTAASGSVLAAPLSIDECVKLALEKGQDAKNRDLSYENAKLANEIARAGQGITLSNGANTTYNGNSMSLSGSVSVKMPVGQNLAPTSLLGNNASRNKKASELDWDNAQLDNTLASFDISDQAKASYIAVVKARQALDIARKRAEKLVTIDLPDTQLRNQMGLVSDDEVLRVEATVAQAKLDERRLQNSLASLEESFMLMIGVSEAPELEDVKPDGNLVKDMLSQSVDQLSELALANRLDLRKLRNSVAKTELSKEKSRSDSLPYLKLSGNYNLPAEYGATAYDVHSEINNRDGVVGTSLNMYRTYDWARVSDKANWSVGVDISFPTIFDAGIAKRNIEIAENNYQAALDNAERTKRSVKDEVAQLSFGLYEANELYNQSATGIALAEASFATAQAKFNAGLITKSELSDAEFEVYQARVRNEQSGFDVFLALERLQRAVGR